MVEDIITIPDITLVWSDWYYWNDLLVDGRSGGVKIPNGRPGVYEARENQADKRLTIGKSEDLRYRIRQGLIKGKALHSSGKRIRENVDLAKVQVRWAETDRPCAVEEELHKQYVSRFGEWPKYTNHT